MDLVIQIQELRAFLKSLPTDEARDEFALACDTTIGHLTNVSYGSRKLSPESCVLAERVSAGAVRRWHLRPNDWYRIWPELIGADGAPAFPKPAGEPAAQVA